MHMPLNYKDLREELDEILEELEVPRELYHRLEDLKYHICTSNTLARFSAKTPRALEIINDIMPRNITLNESQTYET